MAGQRKVINVFFSRFFSEVVRFKCTGSNLYFHCLALVVLSCHVPTRGDKYGKWSVSG